MPRRSTRTPIVLAGSVLGAGALLAGTLSAGAAVGASGEGRQDSRSWSGGSGWGGHVFGGLLGPRVLHSETVVLQKDGSGTDTVVAQRGEITAKDGSAVTVTSRDDFSSTWTFDADTRIHAKAAAGAAGRQRGSKDLADLAVGDVVMVAGTETGAGSRASVAVEVARR